MRTPAAAAISTAIAVIVTRRRVHRAALGAARAGQAGEVVAAIRADDGLLIRRPQALETFGGGFAPDENRPGQPQQARGDGADESRRFDLAHGGTAGEGDYDTDHDR